MKSEYRDVHISLPDHVIDLIEGLALLENTPTNKVYEGLIANGVGVAMGMDEEAFHNLLDNEDTLQRTRLVLTAIKAARQKGAQCPNN